MMNLELKGSKHIYNQENSPLSLHYFLTSEFYNQNLIYGIQILSCRDHNIRQIHSETLHPISYSPDYVLNMIQLCMENLVTPTDLFSSADTLMDLITE